MYYISMKFLKEDKKYYNDLELEVALQNKEEILKELCTRFQTTKNPTIGGYYILPDGLALKAPKDHLDFDKYLIKNKVIKKNSKMLDFADGSQFLDALNCIRIRARGGKDSWILPYLELPEKQPNQAQYSTLLSWLDFVFDRHATICVENYYENLRLYYNTKDKTPEDLLKIIKQSYITHVLAEAADQSTFKNYGYHAGDLGKSEDYFRQSGGRGTGHFGTGTYFVGDPKKIEHYNNRDGQEAPKHIVDFTPYKLYKPSREETAFDLHSALKLLNDYTSYFEDNPDFKKALINYQKLKNYFYIDYNKWNPRRTTVDIKYGWQQHKDEIIELINELVHYYNEQEKEYVLNPELKDEIKETEENSSYFDYELEDALKFLVNNLYLESKEKISNDISTENLVSKFYMFDKDKVIKALDKVRELQNSYKKQGGWHSALGKGWDSLSTIFMKALGYEGVDVRHLPALDNTTYGSVIYDLKPETIVEGLKESLQESLLLEKTRQDLINKSKRGDSYSKNNQAKGRNRWERRTKSRIANYVQQYNKIDMNRLFTKDELVVGINVQGETNNYVVTVRFDGAISEIQQQIKRNNNKLEFKCIVMALNRLFNLDNVYFRCTCPDFIYRQAYWATQDGYIEGTPEIRPSDITNPNNTKGGGCKHINLVLGNIDWIMKISSVINNYIHWMEENRQRQYADVMFPKLFGMPYDRAVQLDLFDTGENDLSSKEDEITLSNKFGRDRGKFRSDQIVNNQQKFTKKQISPEDKPDQLKLDLNLEDTETK